MCVKNSKTPSLISQTFLTKKKLNCSIFAQLIYQFKAVIVCYCCSLITRRKEEFYLDITDRHVIDAIDLNPAAIKANLVTLMKMNLKRDLFATKNKETSRLINSHISTILTRWTTDKLAMRLEFYEDWT